MLQIIEADSYTHPEKFRQEVWSVFLNFTVSGVVRYQIDSGVKNCIWNAEGAFIGIFPEPFTVDFEYNHQRENYVIVCGIPGLEWNPDARKLYLNSEGIRIELAPLIPVPEEKIAEYKGLFQEVVHLARSPLPENRLAAQYKLTGLLPLFFSSGNTVSKAFPPHLTACLKAFDQDPYCRKKICEIANELGCSQVHLRKLFLTWLHLDPGEYRLRLRYSRICELLKQRDLSQKEIADLAGMKNVTHLHSFIRKQSGMTVNQLRNSLPH